MFGDTVRDDDAEINEQLLFDAPMGSSLVLATMLQSTVKKADASGIATKQRPSNARTVIVRDTIGICGLHVGNV